MRDTYAVHRPTLLLKTSRKSAFTTRNRKSLRLSSSGPLHQHILIWGKRIFGKPRWVKQETPISPMPRKATSLSRTYHSFLISINCADRFHSVMGPTGTGKSSVGSHGWIFPLARHLDNMSTVHQLLPGRGKGTSGSRPSIVHCGRPAFHHQSPPGRVRESQAPCPC